MNFKSLSDEQLALLYQAEENEQTEKAGLILDELFNRYSKLLHKKSANAEVTTGLDFNLLFNKHLTLFWKAVKNYNPNRGASFKTFLMKKLSKGTYEVLMDEKYRKKTNEDGDRLPKPQPVEQEKLEQLVADPQLHDSVIVQDIYEYLKSKSDIYPIILKMIVDGYSYEEIGQALGRKGSPDALKMWVTRTKSKIATLVKKYYEEAGVTV